MNSTVRCPNCGATFGHCAGPCTHCGGTLELSVALTGVEAKGAVGCLGVVVDEIASGDRRYVTGLRPGRSQRPLSMGTN